ncbi:hypothetical protein GF406_10150 [candidate division KSB1 bacterium]|nr:hypothetical protein [candidate division KSB1 bacterium]
MESDLDLSIKYLSDEKGNKTQVIIPIKKFESLLQDLEDLATALERKNEPSLSQQDFIKKAQRRWAQIGLNGKSRL